MKLIFLDVDGVMNDIDTLRLASWENMPSTTHFNRELCARVQRIATLTGAFFVISSTWRREFDDDDSMREFFAKVGLDPKLILGKTPVGYPGLKFSSRIYRGLEIQHWINNFKDKDAIESILILDDDGDMAHLSHRLVQTDTHTGITEADVDEAVRVLNIRDKSEAHLHYKFKGE